MTAARRVARAAPCPCGSGAAFGDCCAGALAGRAPETAVALMRSRYTAFAIGDADYLAQSWHPGTRPDTIEIEPGLRWTGLEILAIDRGGPDDTRGTVEFRARWRSGREDGELRERSRFVRQSGRWWYLDGAVS